jgi:hypothetical protein
MHRLNTVEYNATVRDVLGTALEPADASWRGGELAGFDNMASVLSVDDAQYARYFNAAKTLAVEVFASDELRPRFVTCDPKETTCVRASIELAGLRLFRRPLSHEEVAIYERVYDAALVLGDAPTAGLELAFQALLSSAEFLYRIELDPEPQSAVAHPLSAFELASRLSYFLWSSAPDDALLQAAADGSLLEPSTLPRTARDECFHGNGGARLRCRETANPRAGRAIGAGTAPDDGYLRQGVACGRDERPHRAGLRV